MNVNPYATTGSAIRNRNFFVFLGLPLGYKVLSRPGFVMIYAVCSVF